MKRKPGRPKKLAKDKSFIISVSVTTAFVKWLDANRGELSRSAFIKNELKASGGKEAKEVPL